MRPGESARVTLREVETYILEGWVSAYASVFLSLRTGRGKRYHKEEGALL